MSSFQEIQIPVPWGHISGRESGPVDGKPLLLLHGWLDNCGTFAALQPHLLKTHRCISIDLPGHGWSSPIPVGPVTGGPVAQGPFIVRMVRDHFGWGRFSIVGHSMGSGIGMLYAACFPEDVVSLTILDLVKVMTQPTNEQPDNSRRSVLSYMDMQKKMLSNRRPQYTYEVLRKRLIDALKGDVDEASADALLVRGARRDANSGLYESTYDPMMRTHSFRRLDFGSWREYASRLRCRLLLVLAQEGGTWITPEEEAEAIQTYRQAVPELRLERLPGGHHVHLTHPERVLPIVNEFLSVEDGVAGGVKPAVPQSGL